MKSIEHNSACFKKDMIYYKQTEVIMMKIINKNEFENTIQNGVVLVDFFATWCGPCKMLGPVLEDLAKDYEGKATIVKVDVDQDQDLAMQFGIMSVPTMIIFKNGEAVKTLQGFMAKNQLVSALDNVL